MEPINPHFKVILGSSSVARRAILAEMGYHFSIMTADIDEKSIRTEKPEELVMALAEAKASALVSKLQSTDKQNPDDKPTLLITADTNLNVAISIVSDSCVDALDEFVYSFTGGSAQMAMLVVVYQGLVREKPESEEEARRFIKDYSGGYAETVTSVVVVNLKTGVRKGEWDKVEICFHEIPDQVIESLIEEGKVLSVAGALIIEHPLVLPYIKQVVGGTDSVMGLPKTLTKKLILEAQLEQKKPTTSDALAYLAEVREAFKDQIDKYDMFHKLFKDYKAQKIDTIGLLAEVKELLKEHNSLLIGINAFLPKSYHFTVSDD